MAISDDFSIDYVNKRIWNKYAWGQGGSTTVYTVNALYSHLMNEFDEQGGMDDDVPMSAQTPNAYTMINGWFMDDESHKYLKEGALVTARGDTIIALATCQSGGYVNCAFADIGRQVVWDATERGPLLAYNNTTRKWWIRTTASFSPSKDLTITGSSAAGTATAFDNTGEDLFANVYTLGTIESGTNLYIYQFVSKLSEWWSSGHIDILIKVKEFGLEIDNAVITVYARVYTDLYDFYEIDLTNGGRNAVPLATSDDLDNDTPIATALNYMDSIRIMFINGTITFSGGAGDAAVANKVIHGQTSHATAFILNTTSPFTLANIEGTFQNGEVIEILEEVKFDGQTVLFTTLGQTITATSGGTGVLRKVLQDPEVTGVEGILFLSGVAGNFINEDTLTGSSNGSATQNGAIATNTFTATTSSTVTFGATINKDLDNGAGAVPYNVIIDCAGLGVAVLYEYVKALCRRTSTIQTYPTNGTTTVYAYNGEFYQRANTTYTQFKKASPFGTFAGGTFFGARGIWIQNILGTDSEKYSLIDANNDPQNPPTSASITVVSMIATNDRVLVCESIGTGSGIIKKNQYTLTSQTNQSYIEVTGAIADDAPTTGVVRVVVDYGLSTQSEDIYNYTSIDRSGANDKFILAAPTGESYDSGDRAYNPYIDGNANGSGEATVIVKYAGSVKYIVARVRFKGYIPFQVSGSLVSGANPITAIRTVDGIVQ